ncbi:hypothetical protein [Lelliottia sp. CFBP8978]|uniref:hypothetical protein n=1 Tax=Lelliottia sp. CFBP8978 TaxID=3096522 RepID=UPI002A69E755|nr:hypothetical protein [Lelliottia sp. CFBP8978]
MKTQAILKIERLLPDNNKISRFSEQWVSAFFLVFGSRTFSKRQLFTIPCLLILYSSILFVVWYVWVLVFRNPERIIPAHLPTGIYVALHDFIHQGFWYSLLLDALSVFLIRIYINAGIAKGFSSLKAVLSFAFIFIAILLVFTGIITHLKNDSIEDLYIQQEMYFEVRPVIHWDVMEVIRSSLSFIDNETMLIMTPKGLISNYFIPQAIMLYLSIITQLTLIIVFISYLLTKLIQRVRRIAIWVVNFAGTDTINAIGFILIAAIILMSFAFMCLYVLSFLFT